MSAEAKKGFIISELKKNGCRITSQRKLLIDVILQDECSAVRRFIIKQQNVTQVSAWLLFTAW